MCLLRLFQSVFDQFPFLPAVPSFDYDHAKDDPVKRSFPTKESNPLYHKRPAWSFSEFCKFPKGLEVPCALVRLSMSLL